MQTTTPPTVRGLLGEPVLRLIPRLTGRALDTAIDWVHSSDLTDPTPFLAGDTMLLTTGTQFPPEDDDDYYRAYVDRLVDAGVVALGFGLEVIREGTPLPLVEACAAREVTLVEVPYEIPFIALIRWVADRITARERERDAWTLRAQRAVSVAALTSGTLPAVARALAEQVAGAVVILSSTGEVVLEERAVAVDVAALGEEGRRILARGSRASVDVALPGWHGFATAQTLGPRGSLRGAMGVAGAGRNDVAMQAVVTSAVAIAEVLLRYGDSERHLEQRLGSVIVRLLLDGQVGGAAAVAGEFRDDLPEALRVGILVPEPDVTSAARARLVDGIVRGRVAFVDDRGDRIVFVIEADEVESLVEVAGRSAAFDGVAVGLSAVLAPVEAPAGLAQAARVLSQNPGPGVTVFGESAGGLLDDLWSPAAENLAQKRLAVLADEAGDLVACSRVWLAHNGHWESAAREAGLHRHTLKARIARVGSLLGLDLDEFAGRAELWALLEASRA
ncbi:PucR family transcriptional regulator [Frondihabitans peucedani]|uniref:PucR family transcriptional regulator n=1 Tax=Frondihabitans peucedani TaxID=598626 RepID=A0ABP8E0T1_9MICO